MHSMALTESGRVYVWGINESGQLGRHRECDIHMGREKACAFRPTLIPGYENILFSKAICGPMHSLLLTSDGEVYAFGDNACGQVGNGTEEPQFRPVKVKTDIRFKDVITYFENDLSIGITSDEKYYVWGFAKNKNVLIPTLISESSPQSIFNVYAIYAKNKVTFKTFVINEELIDPQNLSHRSVVEYNNRTDSPFKVRDENTRLPFPSMPNISMNSHILSENSDYFRRINGSVDQRIEVKPNIASDNGSNDENYLQQFLAHANNSPNLAPNDLNRLSTHSSMSNNSSNSELIIGNLFLSHLRQSFNNRSNCDLRIRCEDKVIYCHKTILEIRNELFWQILSQKLDQNSDDIYIKADSYTAFYAFIQYIYGLRPRIDDQNVTEVQNWATIFNEPELQELCEQHIIKVQNTPNSSNICSLYEKAITYGLKDLEKCCVEFAAINWKSIIKSNAFQTMNETLSKRLMLSIIN